MIMVVEATGTPPPSNKSSCAFPAGVRAASRKVFLDDVPTKEAVLARLNQAARDAVRDDSAIAIGHPYRGTIEALAEAGPQLASRGIRLVLVSDLVH